MMRKIESTALMQNLKAGMSDNEWKRFCELAQLKLSDAQLTALAKSATEPLLQYSGESRVTFNSVDEIEAALLIKRHRAPAWLRPQLDSAFNILKNARDGTVKETQSRRLQYMLGIRWVNPPLSFNPLALKKQLQAELFGMNEVIDRVVEELTANLFSKDGYSRPLLLLGPYGTGKTSIVKAISRALACPFHQISMNGISDPDYLKGSSQTYGNGDSGVVIRNTYSSGSTRQVILWDELDKVCNISNNAHSGNVLDSLCDLFGGGYFQDTFLGFPVDLRQTWNFATANDESKIPAVLLNRMEVIRLDDYTGKQKRLIAREFIWPGLKREFSQELDISAEAIDAVVDAHADTCGVRDVEKDLENLMRYALTQKASGTPLALIDKPLVEMRIKPAIRKTVNTIPHVGTATALAVSEFVGRTLELQVDIQDGPEKLVITGLPQEDMMDSAKIALHLAAKHTGKSESCTVRLHLDEGGVRKSGPSAGLMVYLAFWSTFMGYPLSNEICGTGEIDLWGNVKPVGALPTKLLAAERAGCTIAFVPAACSHEVPELSSLKVVPIRNVEEMTDYLLEHKQVGKTMDLNR